MYRIPLTRSVIVTGSEREQVADDFLSAAKALEESAALNMTLLKDWMAAEAKVRELASLIVTQSDSAQQIMQINEIVTDALAKIRDECDADREVIDEIVGEMTTRLAEFG